MKGNKMTVSEVEIENEIGCIGECHQCNERVFESENYNYATDTENLFCENCEGFLFYRDYDNNNYQFQSNMPENEDSENHYLNSWKPSPIFYGSSDTGSFLGLEIEVEFENYSGDQNGLVDYLVNKHWQNEAHNLWYFHNDGSLDNGIEFVSHPFSYSYLMEKLNLDWLDDLRNKGLRSWDTRTCGIHCHISRNSFANDIHLFAFSKLFYGNPKQFQKLAGRHSKDYASFDPEYVGQLVPQIKRKQDIRRYVAVNLTNEKTVEIRIFKGSLNKSRVRMCAELVFAGQDFTRGITIAQINQNGLSFDNFAKYLLENSEKYPNVIAYGTRLGLISRGV